MLIRFLFTLVISLSLSAEIKVNNFFVYNCTDNYNFVVEVQKDAAWLFLPTGTVKALQKKSASGTKYSVENIVLWSKGYEAVLDDGKQKYNCKNDGIEATFERAKHSGVAFRAIGNEPGWILEFTSDKKILFLTNLGKDKTDFTVVKKSSDYNSTEYELHSKYNVMHVRIENRRCRDTMVDRVYESTVYINFDGVNMKGCGKSLF